MIKLSIPQYNIVTTALKPALLSVTIFPPNIYTFFLCKEQLKGEDILSG